MIFIEDDPLSHSYRHRKIEENDKGNKRNEQKPKYIHPNIYIHSKQRQKTRDKKKKNHHFVQEKKEKKRRNETPRQGNQSTKEKNFEQIGEPLVHPRDQRKILLHNAGAKRTWSGKTKD